MFLEMLQMVGIMVLLMMGVMAAAKLFDYAFWYFFRRKEEAFHKLIKAYDNDVGVQVVAFNVKRKEVFERMNSLPQASEEHENEAFLDRLCKAAKSLCDERFDEMEASMFGKYPLKI
jgi:hypothetical protein